jgi:putative membrane protein
MGNWNWDHMGSGMGWGFGFGGIGMILFWVVIIAAVVILAKGLFGGSRPDDKPAGKSALDVLKERYARGEIGREEFEQKKRDLE